MSICQLFIKEDEGVTECLSVICHGKKKGLLSVCQLFNSGRSGRRKISNVCVFVCMIGEESQLS